MNAQRIKEALALVRRNEKSSSNPGGDTRVIAAAQATRTMGLSPNEAAVLGRSIALTEAEQTFLVSVAVQLPRSLWAEQSEDSES